MLKLVIEGIAKLKNNAEYSIKSFTPHSITTAMDLINKIFQKTQFFKLRKKLLHLASVCRSDGLSVCRSVGLSVKKMSKIVKN